MNPFKAFFSSVAGALIGALFFAGSFVLIFWNENRSVETSRSLSEGRKVVVEAQAASVHPGNEGKLVYLSGEAKAQEPLVDPVTHIRTAALVLRRDSEMYQWEESSNSRNRSQPQDYSYRLDWNSSLVNSSNFHSPGHANPDRFRIPGGVATVSEARMSAFRVPSAVLKKIDPATPREIEQADLAALPGELRRVAKLEGGWLYLSKNPATPAVGDERVRLQIVPAGPVSLVARQIGNSLAEYRTSNGRPLLLAEQGEVSAAALFDHEVSRNTVLTWVLRGVGFLAMFLGCRLIIEPLTKFTDWIPLLGGLIDTGATLASGVLTLALSAITIAVAWFAVRPMLSSGLVAGAVGIFWVFKRPARR